ncbi:MAG: sugar transferase, partial [Rhizobiales bacterium]|nr:sugar transferase [Hyphomicrobiales bacterium]
RMISEQELEHFGHWRENLSTVKPGLTGLWQVSGRANLGYEDRVRLDMHYIRNSTKRALLSQNWRPAATVSLRKG